jgi:hypothetical protein
LSFRAEIGVVGVVVVEEGKVRPASGFDPAVARGGAATVDGLRYDADLGPILGQAVHE